MAEIGQQPTSLGDETDEVKKPKRTRSAAATKKPAAKKTGVKRTRKPTRAAENANHVNGEVEKPAVSETEALPLDAPGTDQAARQHETLAKPHETIVEPVS